MSKQQPVTIEQLRTLGRYIKLTPLLLAAGMTQGQAVHVRRRMGNKRGGGVLDSAVSERMRAELARHGISIAKVTA